MAGGIDFSNSPEGQLSPLFPFAPMIMYSKLPMNLVRRLNKFVNKTIKDEKRVKQLDHSDNLVGKVTQEFLIDSKLLEECMPVFNKVVATYLDTDLQRSFKSLAQGTGYSLEYRSGWIVRQFAGEFNPVHIHTECDLSCVGYLKLPPEIDKEWEEDYQDHYPCKGHIEFIHGQPGKLHVHSMKVKPSVGDFFVFPADLMHTVYPFYSDGERRSFSMNISVGQTRETEDGKQETIRSSREGHAAGAFSLNEKSLKK
jgi:hypothetical protein